MSISRATGEYLLSAHIGQATAPPERPGPHVPYRIRRRRAAWLRFGLAVIAASVWIATRT